MKDGGRVGDDNNNEAERREGDVVGSDDSKGRVEIDSAVVDVAVRRGVTGYPRCWSPPHPLPALADPSTRNDPNDDGGGVVVEEGSSDVSAR